MNDENPAVVGVTGVRARGSEWVMMKPDDDPPPTLSYRLPRRAVGPKPTATTLAAIALVGCAFGGGLGCLVSPVLVGVTRVILWLAEVRDTSWAFLGSVIAGTFIGVVWGGLFFALRANSPE